MLTRAAIPAHFAIPTHFVIPIHFALPIHFVIPAKAGIHGIPHNHGDKRGGARKPLNPRPHSR